MIFAILTSGALIVLAFLTFNLAVYAQPFFAGVSAASWAHAQGSGLIGAGLVGLCTGALVLASGRRCSRRPAVPRCAWRVSARI